MKVEFGKLWPDFRRAADEQGRASRNSPASLLARFSRDTEGDIAIIFGLMALVLFMMIGLAVDYARFLSARNQTLAATDAAVLAGARALQTNGGNQQAALTLAQTYYNQAIQSRIGLQSDNIGFAVTDNATAVIATGNAAIETPFMGLAGTHSLPLLHTDGADYSKAVLAVGGNAELNLEISMMLDISGSMCDRPPSNSQPPCASAAKLDAMKDAASDLVDIVVWADQSNYTSRVAIVPFSGDVLPTSSLLASATNPSYNSSITISTGSGRNKVSGTYKATTCVAERAGKDYTDTKPASSHYVLREYTDDGKCVVTSVAQVLPMTNDKTVLKSRISGLAAKGATAGHVGTAWAYYMLSPKWASILPSGSKPVAYGTAQTKKIAVLMTDGAYNSTHDSNGVTTGESGAGSSVNGTDSPSQAKSICADMKKNGIEIYTVGFNLDGNSAQDKATAIDTLSNCATDSDHFYNSSTGDALKAAFRDIALKISTLYLAQ